MVGDAKNRDRRAAQARLRREALRLTSRPQRRRSVRPSTTPGKLSRDLVEGRGTLGKLFNDDKLYSDIEALAGKIQAFLDDGQGLIRDAPGRGSAAEAPHRRDDGRGRPPVPRRACARVTDRLAAGGAARPAVPGSKIAEDIQKITSRLANGEGTLGRLFMEDEVYDNVKAISEDLSSRRPTCAEGNGTIGKLDQRRRALRGVPGAR